MSTKNIIKHSELNHLISESIKTITEDLDQEMAMWDSRSKGPIGRTLKEIENAFKEVIAGDEDEHGMTSSPIQPYLMAYVMDGVSPERFIKGLINTLAEYDMIVCDGDKCKGVDGDIRMSRLVSKLLSYIKQSANTANESVVHNKLQEAYDESRDQQTKRQEVISQIDRCISSGKMFGFDMSDYVDSDGFPAGYMAIGYDPDKDELYVGSTTNSGIMREVTIPYEYDTTLDANLENLYEELVNTLTEQGYNYAEEIGESIKRVNEEYSEENTPEQVVSEINKVRSTGKMFGFNMDDYVNDEGDTAGYMGIVYDPDSNTLYCGSVTNSGVFREAEIDYDLSMSLDANLEDLMEVLSQNLMDQGYYPQD